MLYVLKQTHRSVYTERCGVRTTDDKAVYENMRENQFRSKVNRRIKRNLIKQRKKSEGKRRLYRK